MRFALSIGFALWAAAAFGQKERKGDTVEFELDQNIVWVKATLNGKGPYNFIFDTGASITVVKPSTAEKMGLKLRSPEGVDAGLLGGLLDLVGMNPKVTTLQSIALGDARVDDFEAVVMNVPQADIPLSMAGKSYDGLIGYHFISRFVTTIDYKQKTIKLEPNDFDPGPTFPQPEEVKKPGDPPYFGFSYRTVGDDEANEVGVEGGVVVGTLAKDGPAEKAGLQKGDIIQELDGKRIRSSDEWRRATGKLKPGQQIKLLILRASEEKTVTFKVGKR